MVTKFHLNVSNTALWLCTLANIILFRICELIFHELPARITDIVVGFVGRKPFAVRLCHKMQRGMRSLEYFTTHQVDNLTRSSDAVSMYLAVDLGESQHKQP